MYLVITDLDGTLLDHATYSFEDAKPALEILKKSRIPLVLCTSKTRAEVEVWRERLDNHDPFIVENGGAVFLPSAKGGYKVIQLGTPYRDLVEALRTAARDSECPARGFFDMTPQQVAEACEMSIEDALLAKQREYDEPFLILDTSRTEPLLSAIQSRGLHWTRGGRFHHILGNNDKAVAVERLASMFRAADPNLRTIGLGDGPNDIPFLLKVNTPIIMRTPSSEMLQASVPHASVTAQPGPRGWSEAVLRAISPECS